MKIHLFLILFFLVTSAEASECPVVLIAHRHFDIGSYTAGMERSSLQKAALGSMGHPGHIVDLGTGSGISAHDLARLFPDSSVIGVDLDPNMVRLATSRYKADNLAYTVGNAEQPIFGTNSVDTIFMSSTAHHLTSYGSGKFDITHVINAIRSAHQQLKIGGTFILRDFVISEGPKSVILEIPILDGTAELFEKFAKDFRSSQHIASGVPYIELEPDQAGWRRFQLSLRDANEFILRKDYRDSYNEEIKEEYTFMSQKDFERAFEQAGFRILHSAPIFNPWIIKNRYQGKVKLFSLDGQSLPFPPTNYAIVGEKIRPSQGILLRESRRVSLSTPQFLRMLAVQDTKTGEIIDLVERPGAAIDLIPYFIRKGNLYVLSKQGYPRPITTVADQSGLTPGQSRGYSIEPLGFIVDRSQPTFRQIQDQFEMRAGIPSDAILTRISPKLLHRLYTSPGMADESTSSIALQIKSQRVQLSTPKREYSGFSTSGTVRPIEATQLLRAAQIGTILDARLEASVYELLLSLKRDLGPWIGEEVHLKESDLPVKVSPALKVLNPKNKSRRFRIMNSDQFGQYLDVRHSTFIELPRAQARAVSHVSCFIS